MKLVQRVGLVFAGYLLAALFAFVAVGIFGNRSDDPSSGMAAFGDLILGVGAFGLVAIPVTILGLVLLRPYPSFWIWLARFAIAMAITAPLAALLCLLAQRTQGSALLGSSAVIATVWLALAPGFAALFALAAIVAPNMRQRWQLAASAAIEAASFAALVLAWWLA